LRALKNYDEKSSPETSKNKYCQQVAFVDDQFLAKFNSDLLMYKYSWCHFYGHSLC